LNLVNAIAWVGTGQGTLIAKWSRARHQFPRLAATADLIHRLHQQGIPVPSTVSSIDGEHRVIIDSGSQALSTTVQQWVDGDHLDTSASTTVLEAGACLAQLHHAMSNHADGRLMPKQGDLDLDLRQRIERWLDSEDPGATPQASARLRAQIAALPPLDAQPQLVHNDYRGSNILIARSRVVAVLDFDEAGLNYCMYDLANAAVLLNTRFTNWQPTSRAAREALVAGYRSVQPLTESQQLWLEALVLWRGITAVPPGDDPAGWAEAVASSGSDRRQ